MGKLKVLILFSALVLVGCGKDKTVDQYQREKLQENLSLFQSVAGSYTGLVTAKENPDEVLGALQIDLRAETVVDSSSGGSSSLGTPILVSNFHFLDQNVIRLSALNSFYDPSTGSYSAQIQITRGSGQSEVVMVSGVLGNSRISGEISNVKEPSAGAGFKLERGGPSLRELLKGRKPKQRDEKTGSSHVSTYTGETQFLSGAKRPVQVVIMRPVRGTPEDFLDLVSTVKSVQVNFNYSRSLNLLFENVIFDNRQGLLTGRITLSVGGFNQQMNLECNVFEGALNCKHLTSGSGPAATTQALYSSQPVQPPADDPSDRQSVKRIFTGKGQLRNETLVMKLTVIRPSKGRLNELVELFFPQSEQVLNASLAIAEVVHISFSTVKWDSANGLLEGSSTVQTPDGFTAYIQCHDFYFDQTTKPFECSYWTSRSPLVPIRFEAPGR